VTGYENRIFKTASIIHMLAFTLRRQIISSGITLPVKHRLGMRLYLRCMELQSTVLRRMYMSRENSMSLKTEIQLNNELLEIERSIHDKKLYFLTTIRSYKNNFHS
jgi:flagellar biosynthesis/type III secretory pathway chaperone